MILSAIRVTARRFGIASATLLALAVLTPRTKAEEWTKSYPISGRPNVTVETNDGNVRISTSDTKQVEFIVDYAGYKVDKDLHIESRQDADRVQLIARVSSHWGIFIHPRNIRIEVRMPKDADLRVDTGDGAVETQPVNGTVKIHTGDGSVRAQAIGGDASIDTGDGSITLEGAKGDVRLRTGDGHIDARNIDGKLDATSGDGHIKIDGRFDALNIKTGDGSIDARVLPGSKLVSGWSIHTGDGSVDLVLPNELQADIDASTNDGRISLGFPVTVEGTFSNSKLHGKLNGGGQPLTIHTGDGSIRLSRS
jgi:putative adhesin